MRATLAREAAELESVHARHDDVGEQQIDIRLAIDDVERMRAVVRFDDRELQLLQHAQQSLRASPHRLRPRRIVSVAARRHRRAPCPRSRASYCSSQRGRYRIVTVVPWPGCALDRHEAAGLLDEAVHHARPRPLPCPSSLVVKNGSNARFSTSGVMPTPVSLTTDQHELARLDLRVIAAIVAIEIDVAWSRS